MKRAEESENERKSDSEEVQAINEMTRAEKDEANEEYKAMIELLAEAEKN